MRAIIHFLKEKLLNKTESEETLIVEQWSLESVSTKPLVHRVEALMTRGKKEDTKKPLTVENSERLH